MMNKLSKAINYSYIAKRGWGSQLDQEQNTRKLHTATRFTHSIPKWQLTGAILQLILVDQQLHDAVKLTQIYPGDFPLASFLYSMKQAEYLLHYRLSDWSRHTQT